jgi:hypothetical protein
MLIGRLGPKVSGSLSSEEVVSISCARCAFVVRSIVCPGTGRLQANVDCISSRRRTRCPGRRTMRPALPTQSRGNAQSWHQSQTRGSLAAMIVRSLVIVTLFGLLPLLYCGCEPPVVNAPPTPPPPPVSAETGAGVSLSVESANSVSGHGSQPPEQNSPRSVQGEQPPILLSAGVALPQLLPEGTQIGVSVDYKISGNLKSSRYFLVMESSAGAIAVPVKLSPMGGTLQGFFPPSVRPEHQPFRARIEEAPATGNPVHASNTVMLHTSY